MVTKPSLIDCISDSHYHSLFMMSTDYWNTIRHTNVSNMQHVDESIPLYSEDHAYTEKPNYKNMHRERTQLKEHHNRE